MTSIFDLTNPHNSSGDSDYSSIIFGLLNDDCVVALKNESFTYVYNLGSTSNLDHVSHTSSVTIAKVVVSNSNFMSDHFPLSFSALIGDYGPSSNWLLKNQSVFYANDWDRASLDFFQNVCNDFLTKICVHFDLLMQSSRKNMYDF